MQFGRLITLNGIDFRLPKDHSRTLCQLNQLSPAKSSEIYVGCPVWTDRGYLGSANPPGTRSSDFLSRYSRQFNAVEVNAINYSIPQRVTVRKWRSAATPGFKFCPRFPQLISHRQSLPQRQKVMKDFVQAIQELGHFLGISLLQLPGDFIPEDLDQLEEFLKCLPEGFRVAVELKNTKCFAWWTQSKRLYDLLEQYKSPLVITDTVENREALHQVLTTDRAFIRFRGNNLHPSDYERIDEWVERLGSWMAKGLKEVYFFIDQPDKSLSAELAAYMNEQLDKSKERASSEATLTNLQTALFSYE